MGIVREPPTTKDGLMQGLESTQEPAKKSMPERARASLNNLKPGEWQEHCQKSDEDEERALGRCPPKES